MTTPTPRRSLRHSLREAARALAWVALGFGLFALGILSFCSVHSVGERHDRARLDLRQLEKALQRYVQRTGGPLTEADGLQALVDAGLLEALPEDPWGHEYGYAFQQGQARVWSLGADGLPGGEGADEDVVHPVQLPPPP